MKALLSKIIGFALFSAIYGIVAGITPRHLGYIYREIRMGFPTARLAFMSGYREHESDIEMNEE